MPTGKRMKRRKNIVDYESLDLQTGRLLRGYSFGFQSLSERIMRRQGKRFHKIITPGDRNDDSTKCYSCSGEPQHRSKYDYR